MREILFRGKRRDKPVWWYGSYLFLHLPDYDWTGQPRGPAGDIHYIVDKDDINYAVLPETVGQSTGLTDRNGKTIFEGDIVLDVATNKRYRILYNFSEFVREYKSRFYYRMPLDIGDYEIIGNFYDNPELMEDKQC